MVYALPHGITIGVGPVGLITADFSFVNLSSVEDVGDTAELANVTPFQLLQPQAVSVAPPNGKQMTVSHTLQFASRKLNLMQMMPLKVQHGTFASAGRYTLMDVLPGLSVNGVVLAHTTSRGFMKLLFAEGSACATPAFVPAMPPSV